MKCSIAAKALKSAIKSVESLQSMGVEETDKNLRCIFRLEEDILTIEGAHLGAYVKKLVPATALRNGTVGITLESLSKFKFSGDVVLEHDEKANVLIAKTRKSEYKIPVDQTAVEVLEDTKPSNLETKAKALVPTELMVDAVSTVTFTPGLKKDDLKLQWSVKEVKDGVGRLEVTGRDHFSYARYVKDNSNIKVKENIKFVLQSSAASTALKEIATDKIGIGLPKDPERSNDIVPSVMRFNSQDADIYYPLSTAPYYNPAKMADEARQGTLDGGFVALRQHLKEAVDTVKVVGSATAPVTIMIGVAPNKVQIAAESNSKRATASLTTQKIKTRNNEPFMICMNEKYLSNFLALAPKVAPLRIESWNQRYAIIRAQKIENGLVEYFVSQVKVGQD